MGKVLNIGIDLDTINNIKGREAIIADGVSESHKLFIAGNEDFSDTETIGQFLLGSIRNLLAIHNTPIFADFTKSEFLTTGFNQRFDYDVYSYTEGKDNTVVGLILTEKKTNVVMGIMAITQDVTDINTIANNLARKKASTLRVGEALPTTKGSVIGGYILGKGKRDNIFTARDMTNFTKPKEQSLFN